MQAQAQAQQKKPIVEFRAGILNQKGKIPHLCHVKFHTFLQNRRRSSAHCAILNQRKRLVISVRNWRQLHRLSSVETVIFFAPSLIGTTVTADERRGTVQLVQSDDGLLHLHWKLRNASASDKPEVDLILFEKGCAPGCACECGCVPGVRRVFVRRCVSSGVLCFPFA